MVACPPGGPSSRDLYADFGEFTLTGLALAPVDGDFGLFDHIYMAQHPATSI